MVIPLRMADLLGAWIAESFYISAIGIFVFRLAGIPKVGYWLGLFELTLVIPLILLLVHSSRLERNALYYIQIACMCAFLLVEALLDYICKVEFRHIRWAVILYTVLFFAASGGMLGIAAQAGSGWRNTTVITFFVMAVLVFVQRVVTGR